MRGVVLIPRGFGGGQLDGYRRQGPPPGELEPGLLGVAGRPGTTGVVGHAGPHSC